LQQSASISKPNIKLTVYVVNFLIMEEHIVRIIDIENVTHDVKRIRMEKPEGYSFIPGQATDVSINVPGLKDEKRPFTFTSLNSAPFLEFTIKIYPLHNGVTKELNNLIPGDELIIRDVWGDIAYRGEGVFIAGGAGITPFISILRDIKGRNEISGNILLFSNKTRADIIYECELKELLGKGFINILSEEKAQGYYYGMIDDSFLKDNLPVFYKKFYLCGPPPMMDSILKHLTNIGVGRDSIIMEKM
jgi:ferredoxin-NADP reductase